jgi:hypothetical protein
MEELQKVRKHNNTKHVEFKHGLATSGTGHSDPPHSTQAQGGRPKDNLNHGSGERKEMIPDASAENSVEDVSNNVNSIHQETTEDQIQKVQAKADVIGKLQRELKQDIQRFKLNHSEDCGINRDMVNNGTRSWAPCTAYAAPDLNVHWKLSSCASFHNKIKMIKIWTGKWVQHTAAAPDQVIQAHNRGKK